MFLYKIFLPFLLIWQFSHAQRDFSTSNTSKVVSTLFCVSCLTDEEKGYKKTFLDLPASAQIGSVQPTRELPGSITICSTINTFDLDQTSMFFLLLGQNNGSIIGAAIHKHDFNEKLSRLYIAVGTTLHVVQGSVPLVLPGQWVTSCLALSFDTGLIQWVVD